jgi:hypothetical protein
MSMHTRVSPSPAFAAALAFAGVMRLPVAERPESLSCLGGATISIGSRAVSVLWDGETAVLKDGQLCPPASWEESVEVLSPKAVKDLILDLMEVEGLLRDEEDEDA